MKDRRRQLEEWLEERRQRFFGRPWEERSSRERYRDGSLALVYLTIRETLRDRGPMLAASLSFWTVLAMVPMLTVAASLMAAFGVLEGEDGAFYAVLHQMFPDVASGIASYLSETVTESAQAVGGIGAITLLIIGLVLFNAIEETLTRVWRGSRDRSMVAKMLTFYAIVTFGPVLIALSIVQTASAQLYLVQMGINLSWAEWALPPLYALIAFTLLNKLVPDANVSWRSAMVGGVFTMVAFELAKWGFNLYVNQLLLQTYDRVYGALALIPIALIWVYVSWFVLLLGAELSYAVQHLKELLRAEAGDRSSQARPTQHRIIHPMVALEVLAPVIRAFDAGDGPVKQRSIEENTRLPRELVDDVLEQWKESGTILGVADEDGDRAFLPARPPREMPLDELIVPFWSEGRHTIGEEVDDISTQYLKVSRQFFGGLSAQSLAEGLPTAQDEIGAEELSTPQKERGAQALDDRHEMAVE